MEQGEQGLSWNASELPCRFPLEDEEGVARRTGRGNEPAHDSRGRAEGHVGYDDVRLARQRKAQEVGQVAFDVGPPHETRPQRAVEARVLLDGDNAAAEFGQRFGEDAAASADLDDEIAAPQRQSSDQTPRHSDIAKEVLRHLRAAGFEGVVFTIHVFLLAAAAAMPRRKDEIRNEGNAASGAVSRHATASPVTVRAGPAGFPAGACPSGGRTYFLSLMPTKVITDSGRG